MGVMSMGYQRKLASSFDHPRILSLGAFQRFLEGGWSPHKRNQCPLPFLPKLGSTRSKAYNYAAVCPAEGRTHTPWDKEGLVDLRLNINEVRKSPEL